MNIKDRLSKQRKAAKMTQAQMAEELKISLTSYKKYEAGEGLPTMENLIKIANTLEISIDELCGRWETSNDEKLKMRIRNIEKLDKEEQEIISVILESMLIRHSTKAILDKK